MPVREPVKVNPSQFVVPEPDVSLQRAVELALEYRLDLQNKRDKLEDSARAVANAKNNVLPDLNLTGSVTLPTAPGASEGGVTYEFDQAQYLAGASFSLPLDRQTEKLQLRAVTIAEQQAKRDFEMFRDQIILDVRAKTRELDRARLNLILAEERVKINQRRKEEQSLKPDEVTTQQQVDTANDLRDSERARDQAKTDLRNAVLDFLLATGQLRVQPDGMFQPLPGMQNEQ
jgi:outer membrane protein TolC